MILTIRGVPRGWRKGQFIFNFLAWLGEDIFYLEDDKLDFIMKAYIKSLKSLKK